MPTQDQPRRSPSIVAVGFKFILPSEKKLYANKKKEQGQLKPVSRQRQWHFRLHDSASRGTPLFKRLNSPSVATLKPGGLCRLLAWLIPYRHSLIGLALTIQNKEDHIPIMIGLPICLPYTYFLIFF